MVPRAAGSSSSASRQLERGAGPAAEEGLWGWCPYVGFPMSWLLSAKSGTPSCVQCLALYCSLSERFAERESFGKRN